MNCLNLIKDFNMLVDHMKCKCIFVNTSVYFARYTVLLVIQEMVFLVFKISASYFVAH